MSYIFFSNSYILLCIKFVSFKSTGCLRKRGIRGCFENSIQSCVFSYIVGDSWHLNPLLIIIWFTSFHKRWKPWKRNGVVQGSEFSLLRMSCHHKVKKSVDLVETNQLFSIVTSAVLSTSIWVFSVHSCSVDMIGSPWRSFDGDA